MATFTLFVTAIFVLALLSALVITKNDRKEFAKTFWIGVCFYAVLSLVIEVVTILTAIICLVFGIVPLLSTLILLDAIVVVSVVCLVNKTFSNITK